MAVAAQCAFKRTKAKHVVADSSAFLKNVPLHEISENVYTIEDVVKEIKDSTTRQRLAVLPYDLQFRKPSSDAIRTVSEFAKLTGDFRSLSAVDIRVLALTYQLEKEYCGTEHIRVKPSHQIEISQETHGKQIPGFFWKKEDEGKSKSAPIVSESTDECKRKNQDQRKLCLQSEASAALSSFNKSEVINSTNLEDIATGIESVGISHFFERNVEEGTRDDDEGLDEDNDDVLDNGTGYDVDDKVDDGDDYGNGGDDDEVDDDEVDDDDDDDDDNDNDVDDDDDDDDNDDDDGWITPNNLTHTKEQMGKGILDPVPADVTVGCLTRDFAMQNVLIQMGLHVISVDGLLIRETRNYILKCHGCFRVTSQLGKSFCPWCGNNTLLKMAVSVDENGVTRYHIPQRRKPFNIRGKRYSLPHPKGGRHSNQPVLCEDQPRRQQCLPRKKDLADVFHPDYVARKSPFTSHDVTSRAVQLGYHLKRGVNRRNPNEVRKKSGRRKK